MPYLGAKPKKGYSRMPELRELLKDSTRILYDELLRQGSTVIISDDGSSLLEYTDIHGDSHFLFSTCSDKSPATGLVIADSKTRTAMVAARMNIPMPAQTTCHDIRDARKFLSLHKMIVTKPALGSGGKGVSIAVSSLEELERDYAYAKSYSHQVVVQQHIEGSDVRLLVIDGTFCSAVIRKPAHVIGDGHSSIEELIHIENTSDIRNDSTLSTLLHINPHAARRYLGDNIENIPPTGKEVRVIGPANVSLGGSLHEATHLVTQQMITDAEAISRKTGLGICGVDMMWDRTTNAHYLIEINATPGIDIHDDAFSGTSSDCAKRYVTWLMK
jgi:D-alanine-D-alanine ligase-like ATP-grasp enzyme